MRITWTEVSDLRFYWTHKVNGVRLHAELFRHNLPDEIRWIGRLQTFASENDKTNAHTLIEVKELTMGEVRQTLEKAIQDYLAQNA